MSDLKHQIFSLGSANEFKNLDELIDKYSVMFVDDQLETAIEELYDIEYPHEKDQDQKSKWEEFRDRFGPLSEYGNWVYYPWLSRVVHFPPVEDLRRLRTSRNRNLITADEQRKLYDATIFIAGLSVGSNVVEAMVSQGIGGTLVLADMDSLEPSNLNRIRAPFWHIGLHKADAIAMRVAEIDPYINVVLVKDGVTEKTLDKVIKDHDPDVLVDEMDTLPMKIRLRERAIELNRPVLSAADDGDSTLLDIERYDQGADLFNDRIPHDVLDKFKNGEFERQALGLLIGKYFVGSENIPLRMYQSLQEVGKTLPSWPQLGGAAALSGVVIAYSTMQIILGGNLKGGRFVIGPDQVLGPDLSESAKKELKQYRQQLDSFNS